MATALTASLALLIAAPQADAARWSPARTIEPVGDFGIAGFEPTLASNPRGDRVLTYQREGTLRIARARPGRGFGDPVDVPGSTDGFEARAAVDARGNVLIVWRYDDETFEDPIEDRDSSDCCPGLKAVQLSRAGEFGDTVVASPVGEYARPVAVTMESTRHYAIVYTGRDTYVRVAGGRRLLIPAPRGQERSPAEAVAWFRGSRYPRVLMHEEFGGGLTEAIPDRDGVYGEPRVALVFPKPPDASYGIPEAQLVADPRGGQAVSWRDSGHTRGDNGTIVGAAVRPARGGRFRARVLATGRRAYQGEPPSLALAPSGAAIFAWRRESWRGVLTAGRLPGRGIGPTRGFWHDSDETTSGCPPVAVNSSGRVLHMWRRGDEVAAAFSDTGDRRRGDHVLGMTGYAEDCDSNFAALDERGRATAVWSDPAAGIRVAYYR